MENATKATLPSRQTERKPVTMPKPLPSVMRTVSVFYSRAHIQHIQTPSMRVVQWPWATNPWRRKRNDGSTAAPKSTISRHTYEHIRTYSHTFTHTHAFAHNHTHPYTHQLRPPQEAENRLHFLSGDTFLFRMSSVCISVSRPRLPRTNAP